MKTKIVTVLKRKSNFAQLFLVIFGITTSIPIAIGFDDLRLTFVLVWIMNFFMASIVALFMEDVTFIKKRVKVVVE